MNNNIRSYKNINKQKAVKSLIAGIAGSLIIIFAIPPLLINPILNGLKNSAVKEIKQGNLSAEKISYSLLFNEVSAREISYSGMNGSLDSLYVNVYSAKLKNTNWFRYFLGWGISAQNLRIDSPNAVFKLKEGMRNMPVNKGFSAIPAMFNNGAAGISSMPEALRNIYIGGLYVNSGSVIRYAEERKDSIGEFNIDAEDIEFKEGEYRGLSLIGLTMRSVSKNFSKGYKLNAGSIQYDGRRKSLNAEEVRYYSDWSDEDYFAALTLREDKLAVEADGIYARIGEARIVEKPRLVVENIKLQKPRVHITTPKYIPLPENPPKAVMPNEALLSLPFGIKVDKLYAEDGIILLSELYQQGGKYAELVFGEMYLEAENITGRYFNNSSVPARLKAKAYLQNKGEMSLELVMPLHEKDFSYKAEGSLKKMDLTELNGYLEHAEYIRITSGSADSVTFKIQAREVYADAEAAPVYRDLKIESLDEATGRESGLDEITAGFIANEFVLRQSNPEGDKALVTASITRTFNPDETFFERLWIPLKMALGKVVGFKE